MTVHDGLDNPRRNPAEDAFNRWPFSKRLADTIAQFDTSTGAPVFGIFGKWGYGKSTVLNYIKHELESTYADKVVLFEFNPWLFSNQEELLAAFLVGLTAQLRVSLGTRAETVGKLLEKGSGLFGMLPLIGSGFSKFTEKLGKDLADDPLQSRRERAFDVMREATRTVVVLIDDLDRLDRDEILTMLKLVRLNANFPHVIYVLAFDDDMVANAVGTTYGGGTEAGRQFLEKIVQYPFSLPAVSQDRLIAFVVSHAREACAAAKVSLSAADWEAFQQLMLLHLYRRLTTPRQAIRYANALRFALPLLKGEVDPFEQMLIEGLRILFPEVYRLVRDDMQSFTGSHYCGMLRADNRDLLAECVKGAMSGAPNVEIKAATAAVSELFSGPWRPQSVKEVRYFDRYFSYAVAEDDIPDSKLIEALRSTEDDVNVSALIERLAQPDLARLLQAVSSVRLQLEPQAVIRLSCALVRNAKLLMSYPDYPPEQGRWAVHLLVILGFQTPNEGGTRERLIMETIHAADPIEFAILYANHVDFLSREATDPAVRAQWEFWKKIGMSEEPSGEDVTRAQQAVKAAMASLAAKFCAYAEAESNVFFTSDSLLSKWHRIDSSGQREWLEAHLAGKPEDAIKFLSLLETDGGKYLLNGFFPLSQIVSPSALSDALSAYIATNPGDPPAKLDAARRFIAVHTQPSESNGPSPQGS